MNITEKSGLLDLLEPGDNVMADRGFDVGDLLHQHGITLNIPPFLGQREQLTSRKVEETRRIACHWESPELSTFSNTFSNYSG